MAKAPKFYVVWKGKNSGIFSSWDDCKKQITGFNDAKYKSFHDRQSAEKAFSEGFENHYRNNQPVSKIELLPGQKELIGKPEMNSIAVDAACSGNPGAMEYRGVETASGREIFRQGPFPEGTNNIGEFLAIVHGLALLKKMNSDLPLYSDSANAITWVKKKKAGTKLEQNEKNAQLFEMIKRAETWLKENTYHTIVLKWLTEYWGEIPADFGRK